MLSICARTHVRKQARTHTHTQIHFDTHFITAPTEHNRKSCNVVMFN